MDTVIYKAVEKNKRIYYCLHSLRIYIGQFT